MNMKIESTFAVLDVKAGRKRLAKHFASRPSMGHCPPELRIPVIITGYIDGVNSNDDGTSIEFAVIVEKVETP